MSELRYDELSGHSVIVAAARSERPHTTASVQRDRGDGEDARIHCPFCPGHETMTPPEICRTGHGEPDEPGWRIRVVPNLYPIVGGIDAHPGTTGAHEVVVLSPDHGRPLAALDEDAAVDVFVVLRDRVRRHLEEGHAYSVALVNHLWAAGASIAHPHAQIVGLDFVPPAVEAAMARAAGNDLVGRDIDAARRDGLVVSDDEATVWCPWASSSPFTMRVAHASARARFGDVPETEVAVVARAARHALRRLAGALDDPPYNLVVHSAPAGRSGRFHWYVEITARVLVMAGFEQATGILVNTTAPEVAAARLRDAAE